MYSHNDSSWTCFMLSNLWQEGINSWCHDSETARRNAMTATHRCFPSLDLCCTGSSRQPTSSSRQIPQQHYLYFDKALNTAGVLKKLQEFNTALSGSAETQSLAMSSEQSQAGLEQMLSRYKVPAAAC